MSHKHPPSTGEERAPAERQSIYHDPNLRRQKRAEARELNARYAELCGPVTVTKVEVDQPKYGRARGRPPLFDKETARLQRLEQERRRTRADDQARRILAQRYKYEFHDLRRIALNEINAQCGPLPGDTQ